MTDKRFFWITLSLSIATTMVIALLNRTIDIYGLFSDSCEKEVVVYGEERASKYLMAYNYIPNCFDGILLGPSLSANLNTQSISGYSIYNISLMGATISELKTIVEKIDSSNMDLNCAIVCINPYLTTAGNVKDQSMTKKAYWGAYGSLTLLRVYFFAFIRKINFLPKKFPQGQYNSYGYNNYDIFFQVENVEDRINRDAEKNASTPFVINEVAIDDLVELIKNLNDSNVKLLLYYHPVPYEVYSKNKVNYDDYWEMILNKLDIESNNLIALNLCNEDNAQFTQDINNYIDHGHLSKNGQAIILQKLEEALLNAK